MRAGGTKVDEKSARLFSGDNIVFVATVMGDGSPQVTPVWADYENGHIMVNTARGRVKHRNVVRDPRVAVSVVSRSDPLDMVAVRGTVVGVIPDGDYAHADRLARQYMGRDRYPFRRDGEERITLKILPQSVHVMPRIAPAD